MTSLLDVNAPDNTKVILDATNPNLGDIGLHASQILAGTGEGKVAISSSYFPQSGIAGFIENSQFDIVVPPTRGSGVDVVDQIFLQMNIKLQSAASPINCALKPVQNWFNRVDISVDGSTVLQSIYFDQQYAQTVMNSDISNLDDLKAQMNLDPRNYLCWFDKQAKGSTITVDAGGNVTTSNGTLGQSSYLAQAYFAADGAHNGAVAAGQLANYYPFAKGGMLNNVVNGGQYTFYMPITNTILQSAKVLMNELNANMRFRFYMNPQVKLFDEGTGVNATQITINQATLWLFGTQLSPEVAASMSLKYRNPVVSSYNYYMEFTQEFTPAAIGGTFNEAVLNPLVGMCSSLLFFLEDTRQNIAYPAANGGGDKYIQNNMMTVPIQAYQFVTASGQIFGSGTQVPGDLQIALNTFRKYPKTVSGDNRLYFKKFYTIDFANDPITAENEAVYGGVYQLTGRERLRFYLPDISQIANYPADVFPNVELNGEGYAVNTVPASDPYSSLRLHVIASIRAEAIESNGLISFSLPRF